MANRQPDSPATRIMECPMYRSGKRFTAKEIADAIELPTRAVSSTLSSMKDRGDIVSLRDGRYHKPREKHWIHKQRLANPILNEIGAEL